MPIAKCSISVPIYLIFLASCYQALTNILKEKLLTEGRKPYVIPVGGSNSLGTWYILASSYLHDSRVNIFCYFLKERFIQLSFVSDDSL